MNTFELAIFHLNQNFLIIFVTTSLLLIFFTTLIRFVRTNRVNVSYTSKSGLFTPAELSFYHVLKQAISSDTFEVFGKVRIADVIQPSKSLNPRYKQSAFNRISSKHFDYVICDPDTLAVLAVIELDDKSHESDKTMMRDHLVNKVCQSANVKLIRFKAKRAYQIEHVRNIINEVLET